MLVSHSDDLLQLLHMWHRCLHAATPVPENVPLHSLWLFWYLWGTCCSVQPLCMSAASAQNPSLASPKAGEKKQAAMTFKNKQHLETVDSRKRLRYKTSDEEAGSWLTHLQMATEPSWYSIPLSTNGQKWAFKGYNLPDLILDPELQLSAEIDAWC